MNTLTRGVQQTVLENGLTILTKEVHTAPVVSVQVWYRVGSRNETAGTNGISHQLEHLLFKGTQSRPIQFGRLFSALGSASNAFTSYDMTAYFGTVGSDKLEALLTLEADRMCNALIDDEQLESEKNVVISELQGYENSPEYRLSEAVMRQAFPDRPYGLPVGGTKTDVQGFTVEQVRTYYQHYYNPANAVLVVVGDFEPKQLQHLIQQTFGKIPVIASQARFLNQSIPFRARANSIAPSAPIHLQQPGSAALIEAVYPIPDVQHPDVPALGVMDTILSVGRHSRFFQDLVETGLASQVGSDSAALVEPGWYDISVTLSPGEDLQKVDAVLQKTIATFQAVPVSPAELERAKTQLMAHFVMSNREIDAQASQLAYNQIIANDYRYSDRYLECIQQVTLADVQRVAKTYLDPTQRTVGYFEPTQLDGSEDLGGFSPQQTAEDFSPGEPVDPAEVAQYLPPMGVMPVSASQALPKAITLTNGLRVLLLADHSSPTVTLHGHILAGNGFDLQTKGGVASLTAQALMGGTVQRDALALAKALEDRGAGLDFSAFREGVEVEGYALAQDLGILLETLGEVLQQANFPNSELELERKQAISNLKASLDDPARLGRRVLQQKMYPSDHPFYVFATVESLVSITKADVLAFYRQQYTPDNTVLALVGDFDADTVQDKLQDVLGHWSLPASPVMVSAPCASLPTTTQRVQLALPGKSQVSTFMGYPGIRRRDPRFYAALLLNQILGSDTLSSRLGSEIRDRQGLTYGIYSYFAAGHQAGPFAIEMQTAPENTEQAIQSTIALLRQIRQEGVSESELKTAKRSLISSYPVELANPDTVAQRVLMNAVDGFEVEEIREFPGKVEAVSMEEVNQAIQDLIQPDHLWIVSAGAAH